MPQERVYTINNVPLNKKPSKKQRWFKVIDGAEDDCLWGRLSIKGTFSARLNITVMAAAINDRYALNDEKTEDFILKSGGITVSNSTDLLLYKLSGRYLWIGIILEGEGEGKVDYIRVYQKGDNFMDTFPEVYRERGGFFHRYLSVFSAIYNDFDRDIQDTCRILSPDTAPLELLPVLAEWMGLDVKGGFLKETVLRNLVKEGYSLLKYKGTKRALERVTEIVLGKKAVILEKCKMQEYTKNARHEQSDIVVMTDSEVVPEQRPKLRFLLEQFKPVKCTMKIMFLVKRSKSDSHIYMDMNAVIEDGQEGYLDKGQMYGDIIILK